MSKNYYEEINAMIVERRTENELLKEELSKKISDLQVTIEKENAAMNSATDNIDLSAYKAHMKKKEEATITCEMLTKRLEKINASLIATPEESEEVLRKLYTFSQAAAAELAKAYEACITELATKYGEQIDIIHGTNETIKAWDRYMCKMPANIGGYGNKPSREADFCDATGTIRNCQHVLRDHSVSEILGKTIKEILHEGSGPIFFG